MRRPGVGNELVPPSVVVVVVVVVRAAIVRDNATGGEATRENSCDKEFVQGILRVVSVLLCLRVVAGLEHGSMGRCGGGAIGGGCRSDEGEMAPATPTPTLPAPATAAVQATHSAMSVSPEATMST